MNFGFVWRSGLVAGALWVGACAPHTDPASTAPQTTAVGCPVGYVWDGARCVTRAGGACESGMQFDPTRGCVSPEAQPGYGAGSPAIVAATPSEEPPSPAPTPDPPRAVFPADTKTPSEAGPNAGGVANASEVVGALRADFWKCYRKELASDPSYTAEVRLKIHVGVDGGVTQVVGVSMPPRDTLISCMRNAVFFRAKFTPPDGGKAVIHVPVTFVVQR